MDAFEQELKLAFLEEALQLIESAESALLALELRPDDHMVIDQLFRVAHNLKGSAKATGFADLGNFTHRLESLLLRVKKKELNAGPAVINLLLRSNDHIRGWLTTLQRDQEANPDSTTLLAEIDAAVALPEGTYQETFGGSDRAGVGYEAASSSPAGAANALPDPTAFPPEPEESASGSPAQPGVVATPAARAAPAATPRAADESIRVSLARLEKLLNFVGEMVILQSVIKEQAQSEGAPQLRKTVQQLGKVTKEVQDIAMSLRMVPLRQTFQKMQRIVRDTSASLGKRIDLTLAGDDTEVDKTVLENLGDPLVHLVRNAIDHGIENAEERRAAGKPESGAISLRAYHQGGSLVIEIQDDGRGLDADKLRRKAVEKGLLSPDARLGDAEAHQLIFAPGFSTKTEVTDVSGRGVGLDVVKTNITAMQGDVTISTVVGRGTCFVLRLPLTLAIIDGMIIRTAGERYVVPLLQVHETLRPAQKDVHAVTGVGFLFNLRGETMPLLDLSQILGMNPSGAAPWERTAIVVRDNHAVFAVVVDDVMTQAQLVIKQLGAEYKRRPGISSSAILGDGRPALILELAELCQESNRKPQQRSAS